MNEEDLYQIAKDELNSRNRIPDLWARACALATDDVDEARYLYTNLRVEQLAAEKDIDLKALKSNLEPAKLLNPNDLLVNDAAREQPGASSSNFNNIEFDTTQLDGLADKLPMTDASPAGNGSDPTLNISDLASFSGRKTAVEPEHPAESNLTPAQIALRRTQQSDDSSDAVDYPDSQPAANPAQDTDSPAAAMSLQEVAELIAGGAPSVDSPQTAADQQELTLEVENDQLTLVDDEISDEKANTADTSEEDLATQRIDATITSLQEPDTDFENTVHLNDTTPGTLQVKSDDSKRPVEYRINNDDAEQAALGHAGDSGVDSDIFQGAENTPAVTQSNDRTLDETLEETLLEQTFDQNKTSAVDSLQILSVPDTGGDRSSSNTSRGASTSNSERIETIQSPSERPTQTARARDNDGITSSNPADENLVRTAEQEKNTKDSASFQPAQGPLYNIFRKAPAHTRVVKQGANWSAMLLTLPWLLKRGMLGTALVYMLMWITLLAGLIITGLYYIDNSGYQDNVQIGFTVFFTILCLLGLFYLPLRFANQWYSAKLIQRGYRLQDSIRARSRKKALLQYKNNAVAWQKARTRERQAASQATTKGPH